MPTNSSPTGEPGFSSLIEIPLSRSCRRREICLTVDGGPACATGADSLFLRNRVRVALNFFEQKPQCVCPLLAESSEVYEHGAGMTVAPSFTPRITFLASSNNPSVEEAFTSRMIFRASLFRTPFVRRTDRSRSVAVDRRSRQHRLQISVAVTSSGRQHRREFANSRWTRRSGTPEQLTIRFTDRRSALAERSRSDSP